MSQSLSKLIQSLVETFFIYLLLFLLFFLLFVYILFSIFILPEEVVCSINKMHNVKRADHLRRFINMIHSKSCRNFSPLTLHKCKLLLLLFQQTWAFQSRLFSRFPFESLWELKWAAITVAPYLSWKYLDILQ